MVKIPKIKFMGNFKIFLIISVVLAVLIAASVFVFGIVLDIQFQGGSIITFSYDGELDLPAFESSVNQIIGVEASYQESENIATGQNTVIVALPGNDSLASEQMVDLIANVEDMYGQNNMKSLEINNVDPIIGGEFLAKCLLAVAVSSVLMMVYVAFRFKKIGGLSAGAMAVVALVHDVVVVFGVFVVFGIPINDNFIAVVLTILGFSLNDTIVIYDRIRENERLIGSQMSLSDLVDLSINQSFSRSLVTSVNAVLAMVVVTIVAVIFNVDTIISFSFPLIIGLISGSYSSICLAGPLWVKWQEHKLKTARTA